MENSCRWKRFRSSCAALKDKAVITPLPHLFRQAGSSIWRTEPRLCLWKQQSVLGKTETWPGLSVLARITGSPLVPSEQRTSQDTRRDWPDAKDSRRRPAPRPPQWDRTLRGHLQEPQSSAPPQGSGSSVWDSPALTSSATRSGLCVSRTLSQHLVSGKHLFSDTAYCLI